MALPPVTPPGGAPPPDLGGAAPPAPDASGGDWTPLAAILTNSQGQFKLVSGGADAGAGGAPGAALGAGGPADGQVFSSAGDLMEALETQLGGDSAEEDEMAKGFEGGTDASPPKAGSTMPPPAPGQ